MFLNLDFLENYLIFQVNKRVSGIESDDSHFEKKQYIYKEKRRFRFNAFGKNGS